MACWTGGYVKMHSPTGFSPPAKVGQMAAWPEDHSAVSSSVVDAGDGVVPLAEGVMLRTSRWRALVRVEAGPAGMDSCQDMCLVDCITDGVSIDVGLWSVCWL